MQPALTKLVIKHLRELLDKLEAGTCKVTDDEAIDILKVIAHRGLSKEQACSILNCSRATFDNAVRDGLIPKGRHERGRKELVWYEDELVTIRKR